jgi:hypothetical protein
MENRRIMNLMISILGVGAPGVFLLVWKLSGNWMVGGWVAASYIVVVGVSSFVGRVFRMLEPKWALRVSRWIDKRLQTVIYRPEKNYLDHVYFVSRFLNTKGLGRNQLPYRIFLDQVYVPLKFRYFYKDDAENKIDILHTFSLKKSDMKFVIIGGAGSGKSTYIKYLAMKVAKNRQKLFKSSNIPNKLPIYLPIGRLAPKITQNPEVNIPLLMDDYLAKRDLKLPKNWLREKLRKGKCIVLIDGIDEVADPKKRQVVVDWVQRQFDSYGNNNFVVTSRPYGYSGNPLTGIEILEIKDFDWKQIQEFCQKWYLANETHLAGDILDDGVRQDAGEGARKLIKTLANTKELANLADNPLLLTMIATVYSIKENLPRRRVELYKEIVEVSLERQYRDAENIGELSTAQKFKVLEILAYHMMDKAKIYIRRDEMIDVIRGQLQATNPELDPFDVVTSIKNESGLLLDVEESEKYQFAHKTFQEYFASTHIKANNSLHERLINSAEQEWWREVVRLYAAQTDATSIIEKCLDHYPPSVDELVLAIEVLEEALSMAPKIRARLKSVLEKLATGDDPEMRNLVAMAHISSRIRFINLNRIGPNTSIDDTPITNIEYQVFADQMAEKGVFLSPDHWESSSFNVKKAAEPVLGIRSDDAIEFCKWLTEFDKAPTNFRIPTREEIKLRENIGDGITYWVQDQGGSLSLQGPSIVSRVVQADRVREIIQMDVDKLRKLCETFERQETQPEKTIDILDRIVANVESSGSYSSKKRSLTSIDMIIESQNLEKFRNTIMLRDDELYARFLKLDLKKVQKVLHDYFYGEKNQVDVFGWLPARGTILPITYLDVKEVCVRLERLFESLRTQDFAIPHAMMTIREIILYALNRLRIRAWALYDKKDQPNIYAFLRWYVRITLLFFIIVTHENMKKI